jgi:hypothetical protein
MRKVSGLFVASALTLGACSSEGGSDSPEISIGQCRSPRSLSQPCQGRQQEQTITVEVLNFPVGTDAIVFGWRDFPDGKFHDSIPTDPGFDMAVLKIGTGAVEFSVQTLGSDGADISNGVCTLQPEVIFTPASPEDIATAVRPDW